jgi:hypothetical protein
LADTLVVCGSEFGRTALGESRPGYRTVTGRDHTKWTYRFQSRDFRLTDVHGRVSDKMLA